MELAKITSKGQITVPISIRKALGLKDGDKVVFYEDPETNKIIITNASMAALYEVQEACRGLAEKYGVREDDVVDIIKEYRREKYGKAVENNV